MYRTSSQMEKSTMVRQPKNQLFLSANSSYFCSLGATAFLHWASLNCLISSSDFFWQFILMIPLMASMVHRYISTRDWSRRSLPSSSPFENLSMMQRHMGIEPVIRKLPYCRQGSSLMALFLSFSFFYFYHSGIEKSLSEQSTPKYSHKRRQTWALPLIGQYPIVKVGLGIKITIISLFISISFHFSDATPTGKQNWGMKISQFLSYLLIQLFKTWLFQFSGKYSDGAKRPPKNLRLLFFFSPVKGQNHCLPTRKTIGSILKCPEQQYVLKFGKKVYNQNFSGGPHFYNGFK